MENGMPLSFFNSQGTTLSMSTRHKSTGDKTRLEIWNPAKTHKAVRQRGLPHFTPASSHLIVTLTHLSGINATWLSLKRQGKPASLVTNKQRPHCLGAAISYHLFGYRRCQGWASKDSSWFQMGRSCRNGWNGGFWYVVNFAVSSSGDRYHGTKLSKYLNKEIQNYFNRKIVGN